MANIKSADKRWRQSLKRRLRNRSVKTAVRTHIKTATRAIGTGEPDAESLKVAVTALDKAAAKGIIHPNNAARRKSRLMHRFAVVLATPASATPARTTRSRSAAGRSRATGAKATTARGTRSRSSAS